MHALWAHRVSAFLLVLVGAVLAKCSDFIL